ncbi:MAG TPA: O-methyltransferase [Candidatus Eremiobacteraceae bacterium]
MSESIRDACHDLNNMLGTILVSADVGEKRSALGADREAFHSIAASARKAGELVAQMAKRPETGSGPDLAERDIEYLAASHPSPPPVIVDLEEHCKRDNIPLMDRAGVRLLAALVSAARADTILELGTAYGYSAIWMALAQSPAGRIWTIDPDIERTSIAKSYFERAGVGGRIEVINRPALEAIAALQHPTYDLVFIDALKAEYAGYLEAVLPHVRTSGVIVVDNLLWSHRVSGPFAPGEEANTQAIRDFNRTFLSHPALRATIVPVGDGTGIGVKIA